MKRIFATALSLIAAYSLAFGASTVPVQLLNPSGSTNGQAIVSTGASTAPTWGDVSAANVSGLGTAATANTGTSGATVPLLNGTNTWSGVQTFSTLVTPTSTVGIKATATNDTVQAGSVGEQAVNTASAVSLTSGTPANCTSVNLAPGEWVVTGSFAVVPTAVVTNVVAGIASASVTLPGVPYRTLMQATFTSGGAQSFAVPTRDYKFTTATTIYIVGQATFASGTATASCQIFAWRPR